MAVTPNKAKHFESLTKELTDNPRFANVPEDTSTQG